jgi:hypothetical protein
MKKEISSGFCVDESCDYYRAADSIFCDREENDREKISEHFAVEHIML